MKAKLAFVFAPVALWCLAYTWNADAASLRDLWPVCADLAALEPATLALQKNDAKEIDRLGCVLNMPDSLHEGVSLKVLRCGPDPRGGPTKHLEEGIEWKPELPTSVCELQIWRPGEWIRLFYTYSHNIG